MVQFPYSPKSGAMSVGQKLDLVMLSVLVIAGVWLLITTVQDAIQGQYRPFLMYMPMMALVISVYLKTRVQVWHWFLKLVGAKQFFFTFSPWVRWLGVIATVLIGVGSVWGLAIAPPDYLQGNSYRIIFIHVPAASLALSLYFSMAVLAVISLVWKIKTAQYVAQAISLIGLVFCLLSLITGAIWGKPTWGAYWVWDARLTSMLILAFLYVGVFALFQAFNQAKQSTTPALVLAIVGAVNLPIIKYSVIWWNSLHQGSTFSLTSAPKMPPEMYLPLLVMLLGFYCLSGALVLYSACSLILRGESQHSWVKKYVLESK